MSIRTNSARHSRQRGGLGGAIRVAACLAVAVAASIALLSDVHTSLHTTASFQTPEMVSGWQSSYQSYVCVRQEFEQAVPKGVKVYAGNGFGTPEQLLFEAATLWAVPVPEKSDAQWVATIEPGKGCLGYVIRGHRLS
ncbi:MAG: hypothetical protein WAL61_19115 [Acidimicrobiales bacterium]